MDDNSNKIRLAAIGENSLVNGPGLRKVFYSQGCSHHCKDCFNAHTWPFEGGRMIDIDELVNKTVEESFLEGITFSGGDPFQQADKFAILAQKLKQHNINIWVYTGYTYEELMELAKTDENVNKLLHAIDVLVDGRFITELKDETLKYRGSSNQRIIDVPTSLKSCEIKILNIE